MHIVIRYKSKCSHKCIIFLRTQLCCPVFSAPSIVQGKRLACPAVFQMITYVDWSCERAYCFPLQWIQVADLGNLTMGPFEVLHNLTYPMNYSSVILTKNLERLSTLMI